MELLSWVTPQGSLLQFCIAATSRCLAVVLLIVASFYGSWLWSLLTSTLAQVQKIRPAKKDYRQELDNAIIRRFVRDEFFRSNKNFDHNCNSSQSDKEKGLNVTETFVKNSKGMDIFVKSWAPADSGQLHGLIFLCLGYGDSVTFYAEGLARALALAGYAVYGMDYPGFGMSEGLHGYIPNMGNLVDDVIEQYRIIKDCAELRDLPCFVYGESMGGALALRAHLKEPSMWDGAILVAPMCKIVESMYPSPMMVQILTMLAQVIPKAKLVSINDIMTIGFRDEVKRKLANLNPVFYVGYTRLGSGLQLLRTADYVEKRMHEVSLPMLILHGTQDQVTDPSISQLLYEKAKSTDKTLRLYEDAWHGILQGEPDHRIHVVMKDIISWLDAHAAPKAEFEQLSERELEERVGSAVPSLINFGRFIQTTGILHSSGTPLNTLSQKV